MGAKHQVHQADEARFQRKLNNIMSPLQGAADVFAMSKLFGKDSSGEKNDSDTDSAPSSYIDKRYQNDNFLSQPVRHHV
jgi:hypothetical protein